MKNTYSEMKDSGVAWIGDIPTIWDTKHLFQLTIQVKNKNCALLEQNLLSLSYGKIKRKSIETTEGLLPASFDNYNIVEKDDIVLRLTDLQNDHTSLRVGKVEEKGIITSAYVSVRPVLGVSKYIYYALHSFDLKKGFYGMGSGVRQGLNFTEAKMIRIPFPELLEQTAIAAYLDEKCGTIDEIIAEAKASIEEYKMWKSSVIFEAVTKGLNPHAEMKDSGVEWMGDIPKHWKCVPMKYLLQERNQKNDPIVTSERLSLSIDIGVTLYAEKTTNLDRFKEDVSQYKVALAGDLVLNSMNMIVGAVGIAPVLGCVSPAYYIFYDNSPKHTSARFCDYVFKNKRLRGCLFSLGQGIMAIDRGDGRINTCRLKVSRDDLGRIMLPCPPEDEQEKIITYLDNRFAAIDGIIAEKEALIADMEAYKKSLIFETVTGKRKVC